MFSLLEKIEPTDSFNVWDYKKVEEYWDNKAVYVFWNKEGFEQGNTRLNCDLEHKPIYIGSTRNLGKRLIQHLIYDKYTTDFNVYFYGVDVYVFENYSESHPVIQKKNKDKLSCITLAEIYEIYFINMMSPWFNFRNNNNNKCINFAEYVNSGYYLERRSFWCDNQHPLSQEIINGFDEIDRLNENWRVVNNKVNRKERWINISEFVDKVLSKRNEKNKDKIRKDLLNYIKIVIKIDCFFMDVKLENKVHFEIVRGSGDDIEIAEEALLFFSPPENLIKFNLK